MTALHQFVPTFEPGAIGDHMLQLQRLLRGRGLTSEIFSEFDRAPFRAHRFTDYGPKLGAGRNDVLMYHMAVGSNVADWLGDRPEGLVLDNHNLTPPRLLEPWEPGSGAGTVWGLAQLARLAGRTELGLGDSRYNEQQLIDHGYEHTGVAPILFDPHALGGDADAAVEARLGDLKSDGGADWLFVGRVAPHKAHHRIVLAFAAFRRLHDPAARLWLVGSGSPTYVRTLADLADELGVGAAVHLVGAVPAAVLSAHYRTADVFVCLSRHEGFCVPLLEAWHHHLPIVALAAAAVPETLGAAGLLLKRDVPVEVAEAVARLLGDTQLRQQLVTAGSARLAGLSLAASEQTWIDALRPLLPGL